MINATELISDMALDKAKLGVEADNFLHTNLGKYLMNRAELEVDILKEKLIDAEPIHESDQIRQQIHVARQFSEWITEAISEGQLAIDQLRDMEAID